VDPQIEEQQYGEEKLTPSREGTNNIGVMLTRQMHNDD
jgi:hypothetical protein